VVKWLGHEADISSACVAEVTDEWSCTTTSPCAFVACTQTVPYHNIILNGVRQHSHFITQGNYKATCFEYRLVILSPILSIVSQDAMHTLGSPACLHPCNTSN